MKANWKTVLTAALFCAGCATFAAPPPHYGNRGLDIANGIVDLVVKLTRPHVVVAAAPAVVMPVPAVVVAPVAPAVVTPAPAVTTQLYQYRPVPPPPPRPYRFQAKPPRPQHNRPIINRPQPDRPMPACPMPPGPGKHK